MRRARLFRSLLAACVLASAPAAADDAEQRACLDAYDSGQRHQADGDLVRARDVLVRCSASTCPAIVRRDCLEWSAEIERQIPTIVVSARWIGGSDIAEARVLLDGALVAERLDGRALPLNPGEHLITLEVSGRRVKRSLIVNQGEKSRLVRFALEREGAPPSGDASQGRRSTTEPSASGPGPLPWILAGTSVVAAAGFAYFAIKGTNDLDGLRDDCGPDCGDDALDGVKRDLLVADILLGVSVVSGGAAGVLFATGGAGPADRGLVLSASGTF